MDITTPEQAKELMKKKPDLTISRVPVNVKEAFTKWCEENFCNDYGMGLTFLWKMYMPMLLGFEERFQQVENRLAALENIPEPDQSELKKTLKMCNGKIVEVK